NVLEVLFARSRWAVLLVTPSLDAPGQGSYRRNPGSKSVRIPPGSPPNYRSLRFRARLDVARVIVERRQGRGIPKALSPLLRVSRAGFRRLRPDRQATDPPAAGVVAPGAPAHAGGGAGAHGAPRATSSPRPA